MIAKVTETPLANVWLGILWHETDPEAPEINQVSNMLEGLQERIVSGIRRRFIVVSKPQLQAWIAEQNKLNDSFKELKLVLDAAGKDMAISERDLCQALEIYLIKVVSEKLEAKLAGSSLETEEKGAPGTASSAKSKSKDKPSAKNKIMYIDDEPPNGPELYVVLQQFDSIAFLETIFHSKCIPIHAITLLTDIPNVTTTSLTFEDLKSRLRLPPYDAACVFSRLSCSSLATAQLLFDGFATHWYQLLSAKAEYEVYYQKQSVYMIPEFSGIQDSHEIDTDFCEIKAWLDECISDVFPCYKPCYPLTLNEDSPKEVETHRTPSRLAKILKSQEDSSPEYPAWKTTHFAKLVGVDPVLAEYYLDLYQFEDLLKERLEPWVCVERVRKAQLLERVEAALLYSPLAKTWIQSRGKRVLFALKSIEKKAFSKWTVRTNRKLGFGHWYDLKVQDAVTSCSLKPCYDSICSHITTSQEIRRESPHFTFNEHKCMKKTNFFAVSNPHIICTFNSNRFFASFPYSGSKLFIQLPSAPSSAATKADCKVIYLTSNGWLCYRSTEKGEDACFCIQNTSAKWKSRSQPGPWRKIYKNGDQWVHNAGEVHFYGHDGKRGYKVLDPGAPSSWTWTSASGQVWQNGEPTSQLKCFQLLDPSNDIAQWWREDRVDRSETNDFKLIDFDDGTVIVHHISNGKIEIFVPSFGSVSIENGNFSLLEPNGAKVCFSNEINFTTPSNFSLYTEQEKTQVRFQGCRIHLQTMLVEKLHDPRTPQLSTDVPEMRIASLLAAPQLPLESIQLFVVDGETGWMFHTPGSLQYRLRCAARAHRAMFETTELMRPCIQFGGFGKAILFPAWTPRLRETVAAAWRTLGVPTHAVPEPAPCAAPWTYDDIARRYHLPPKAEAKAPAQFHERVSKKLTVVPAGVPPLVRGDPLTVFHAPAFRSQYFKLKEMGPECKGEPCPEFSVDDADAEVQGLLDTVYVFEAKVRQPTVEKKMLF